MITRTPFRISFFGGGTDYAEYYSLYGGSVLSTTIDKYCYLTVRHLPPFFDYKNQITYSKIERFNSVDEINHPLVREALRYIPVDRIQIAYDADLPACSGIGSSSAFAAGLVQSLHAMNNEFPDKKTIAEEAIYLEREVLQEAGGVQDQIAAAFGGFNRIDFNSNGFSVKPVDLKIETRNELENNLFLLFTGFTRYSGKIAAVQKNNISSRLPQLDEMKALVDTAEKLLAEGNTDDFGRLLDYTWNLKQTLSEDITNPDIDSLYNFAKEKGAIGGKLLGAGGGGFMLLYVPSENREAFCGATEHLNFIPFRFESSGTTIISIKDSE